MAEATRRGLAKDAASWKKGLNWFFTTGRKTSGPLPPGVPSLGHADTGQTDWERRLIERLRLNQYSWRTEQTYRDWAWRYPRPKPLALPTDYRLRARKRHSSRCVKSFSLGPCLSKCPVILKLKTLPLHPINPRPNPWTIHSSFGILRSSFPRARRRLLYCLTNHRTYLNRSWNEEAEQKTLLAPFRLL